jgi:hypothetical protein
VSQFALFGALTAYTVTSPFAFLWFHHVVLKQAWDNDMTDKVTIVLYILSNIVVGVLGFWVQEGCCGK